jgi:alpha-glucosidase
MSSLPWWRGAALYQVYPASFRDSNGDGWGDLRGLIDNLEYIQALGVDGFWLQSILPSPMLDHGYDVTEYRNVNPLFGSLHDFDELIDRCHALGLRLVLDQVYGHTSNRHPWFVASRQRDRNPHSDWYVWASPKPDGTEPNNWRSVTCGPAWTWDAVRGQYFMHHWLPTMPHLDHNNPAVRREMLDVARFWLARGVDGLRLDVVNTLVVDSRLRDNPPVEGPFASPLWAQQMIYDASRPENLPLMGELRRVADGFDERFLLGEIYGERTIEDGIEYCRGRERLHSTYHILADVAPEPAGASQSTLARHLRTEIERWCADDAWPTWAFGTHDAPRVRTRLGGPEAPDAFARVLLALLTCLRGTIMIPQGEELGLQHARIPDHRRRDSLYLADPDTGRDRDGARTPLPWEQGAPHAGFSHVEPWLPVDPRHEPLAISTQLAAPHSTLHWCRRWLARRRGSDTLRAGAQRFVDGPANVIAFERHSPGERLIAAFNLAGQDAVLTLPDRVTVVLEASPGVSHSAGALKLPPFAAALLRL